MKASLSIVVPNWNGKDLLGPCLESLLQQTQASQIIVVDNGSSDGSQEFVKKTYGERVTLVELDKNYGFTGGVNAGIRKAIDDDAEFVALFNNDAEADKDWLKHLLAGFSDDSRGIVTGKFMRADKKHLDSTGDFYTVWGLPMPRGRNQVDSGQFDDQHDVFGATGGASLYRVSMLRQIGLFDDNFFAYFEDVDISFRAQLAGWKVYYEPKAVSYHHVGATSSKLGSFARYHSVKNFLLLYTKDMPLALYIKYLPFVCLQLVRWGITSVVRGEPLAYLRAVGKAIVLTPPTLKKRHTIQKTRKVSVQYINGILYHHKPPKPPVIKESA